MCNYKLINGIKVYTNEDNRYYILRLTKRKYEMLPRKYFGEIHICIKCGKEFFCDNTRIRNGAGRYCSTRCSKLGLYGDKNANYKHGNTNLSSLIRTSEKYLNIRLSVFERDNFTCQYCGEHGGVLNAHHIIRFGQLLNDYNINNIDDALNCDALWDINNQLTLCEACHRKLHSTYGITYLK